MSQPAKFDGFITPEGELISIEDVNRMISFLTKRTENRDEIVQALWELAGECFEAGHFSAACVYYEKILLLVDTLGEKAEVLLAIKRVQERAALFSI